MLKEDSAMLDRFQDSSVSVHSTGENDEWRDPLVVAAGDDFSGRGLVGTEYNVRGGHRRQGLNIKVLGNPGSILCADCLVHDHDEGGSERTGSPPTEGFCRTAVTYR